MAAAWSGLLSIQRLMASRCFLLMEISWFLHRIVTTQSRATRIFLLPIGLSDFIAPKVRKIVARGKREARHPWFRREKNQRALKRREDIAWFCCAPQDALVN